MSSFGKILALTFFSLLITINLFFVRSALAQEQYFFQEEFNLERLAHVLDPDKWIVYPNKGSCIGDTIQETGGVVKLKSCAGAPLFPYIVSKENPIPKADFTATVRFKYVALTQNGNGIQFVDTAPENGAGFTSLFEIGTWEEVVGNPGFAKFHLKYKDVNVLTITADFNFHEFKLSKEGDIYKLYLDNQLYFTSPPTKERVRAIYLGSPGHSSNRLNWNQFWVDYIRVIQNGPIDEAPEPFLDLPWDYGDKDFKEIVFNPNSWFDHEYPLQDFPCCTKSIVNYKGLTAEDYYKSHSGYDYGSRQGVDRNTLVTAAATGSAVFVHKDNSGGAGNMIKIDHGNGYQTWYEHLEEATPGSELIVKDETSEPEDVEKGEVIGRVGLTGKTTGYHIHLSFFRDINDNDDFNDDWPYGLLDPLGWEGDYTDPWEEYSVTDENDVTRNGAKSYKLFTGLLPPKTQTITPAGGIILSDKFKITVPSNALNQNATFKIDFGPFEKASNIIQSIVPSLFLSATNNLGAAISNFNNPLGLVYDYSKSNLSNVNEDSLSFYFFNTSTNLWEKLSSSLDKTNKTISSQTSHFSQFAVMAQLLDTSPPETEAHLTGDKGQSTWYRSNVIVTLLAEDNSGGKGVDYSVYSLDGENWNEYEIPLVIEGEGSHKIFFLSHDNVGNQEEIKTIEFSIDKTIPEAKVFVDPDQLDLTVVGLDENPTTVERKDNLITNKKDDAVYTISDLAGNILTIDVRDRDKDKKDQFRIYSLQYNQDSAIILDQNQFNVSYKDKKEAANVKEQNFQMKDEVKISIKYDSEKNLSTVTTKESGVEKVKEIKPGLSLLWLSTNEGKLEYGY